MSLCFCVVFVELFIVLKTSGQLAWFFAAMVLYPDAQRQAQAEIDRVVGPNRLPTFQDYDHLPYVRALVKETMRWRGVAPLGKLPVHSV